MLSVAKRVRVDPSTTADFFRIDGVSDTSHDFSEPLYQLVLNEHSKRIFGARSRCFNMEWYKGRAWLESPSLLTQHSDISAEHSQTFPPATSGLSLDSTTGKELWKRAKALST